MIISWLNSIYFNYSLILKQIVAIPNSLLLVLVLVLANIVNININMCASRPHHTTSIRPHTNAYNISSSTCHDDTMRKIEL